MKKLVCLIIVIVSIGYVFFLKPINNYVSDTFWNIIGNRLDKEEQERITKVENNKIVQGKDTIVIWKDTFEIVHYQDGDHLSIKTEEISESILRKVTKHKVEKNKLYILSDEGYAIIDDNKICKVLITVPKEEFVNGYSEDENGNRIYNSRFITDAHIVYIEKYNDFSKDEQKVFDKLTKKEDADN